MLLYLDILDYEIETEIDPGDPEYFHVTHTKENIKALENIIKTHFLDNLVSTFNHLYEQD